MWDQISNEDKTVLEENQQEWSVDQSDVDKR